MGTMRVSTARPQRPQGWRLGAAQPRRVFARCVPASCSAAASCKRGGLRGLETLFALLRARALGAQQVARVQQLDAEGMVLLHLHAHLLLLAPEVVGGAGCAHAA